MHVLLLTAAEGYIIPSAGCLPSQKVPQHALNPLSHAAHAKLALLDHFEHLHRA